MNFASGVLIAKKVQGTQKPSLTKPNLIKLNLT